MEPRKGIDSGPKRAKLLNLRVLKDRPGVISRSIEDDEKPALDQKTLLASKKRRDTNRRKEGK